MEFEIATVRARNLARACPLNQLGDQARHIAQGENRDQGQSAFPSHGMIELLLGLIVLKKMTQGTVRWSCMSKYWVCCSS